MLPIGLPELVLIILVGVVFINPKELPGLLRRAGNAYRKIVEMRRGFTRTLEEMQREAEPTREGPGGGKTEGDAKGR